MKERFLEECNATGAPGSLAELNERARIWLGERIHSRLHRGIGAIPADRLAAEVPLLGRCRAAGSTRPMSRPAGCTWPSPRSSGAGCATRSRRAVSANGSRCAKRSGARASRSAGPPSTWPPTPSPTLREWRSGTPATSPKPRALRSRAVAAATSVVVLPDVAPAVVPLRLDIEGDVDVEVPDLARYETERAQS